MADIRESVRFNAALLKEELKGAEFIEVFV